MIGEWVTPRGAQVSMEFREDTTDWNTLSSIFTSDEYGLAELHLRGVALDVGAHLGAAAIALALDNPDLRVIAIEPVPDNARLLRANVARNGLMGRIVVIEAAASSRGATSEGVAWDWFGGDAESEGVQASIRAHRYIGGSTLALENPARPHTDIEVDAVSIAALLDLAGVERFSFVKIDCEGCEAKFLADDADKVDLIVGEFHPPYIDSAGIRALLPDHDVTVDRVIGPGAFTAVIRA
jgi:FkbM family methyltransferase